MSKYLLFLLPIILVQKQDDSLYRIAWLSGTVQDKKALATELQKIRDPNPTALTPVLTRWSRTRKLQNPFAVIQRLSDGHYFKWPSTDRTQLSIYNARPDILATQSGEVPTDNQLTCFFSDTLVVVDSLWLITGQASDVKFYIDVSGKTLPLFQDATTGDILINAILSLPKGVYLPVQVWSKAGSQRREWANGVWYFFTNQQRVLLKESLRTRLAEVGSCERLFNQALPFLDEFWGGKKCSGSDIYHTTQRETLKKLLTCAN